MNNSRKMFGNPGKRVKIEENIAKTARNPGGYHTKWGNPGKPEACIGGPTIPDSTFPDNIGVNSGSILGGFNGFGGDSGRFSGFGG